MPTKTQSRATEAPNRATRSNDSSVAHVVEHIRNGIITGRYQRESKILPKQIAERCGTSFIPVREALRILGAEGFIFFRHNRGAYVTPVSLTDLKDLYELRIEIEVEAVAQSRAFDDSELEEFSTLIKKMSHGYLEGNSARVVKLNHDFHFRIYDHCDSPRRLQIIRQLWLHAERYQHLSLQFRHDAAEDEHTAIINALSNRDHALAAEALRTHLTTTASLLKAGWQRVEPTDGVN